MRKWIEAVRRHGLRTTLALAVFGVVLAGGIMAFPWFDGGDVVPPPIGMKAEDREEQRQRAIEARDPALLPLCTEEDLTNRPDPAPAKSMEPWDHPDQLGCRFPAPRPDQIIAGPRSEPGPQGRTEPPGSSP